MKYLCFLMLCFHNEYFIKFGSAIPEEYALVLLQNDPILKFARPLTAPEDGLANYLAFYKTLLYLCPSNSDPNPILKIISTTQGTYTSPSKKLCHKPVEPAIIKIKGALKNDQGRIFVHWYHIGFLINDKTEQKLKNIENLVDYESLEQDHHFIPMISVYRDVEFQHTMAVNYKIVDADVKKKFDDKVPNFEYSGLEEFADKFEKLYLNQKLRLEELLENNYVEEKHSLVLDSLVNENDMAIDAWKKTSHFKILQIPIWKRNHETWKQIREYLRYVASSPDANTTITAGIGKALTITNANGNKYEYKMKWGLGEETIFIPELYWAAIERNPINSELVTGMFVIMHNLPGAGENNVEKVCDTNVCLDNELWSPTNDYEPLKGRVYCCPMDVATIKKLGVKFLLPERKIFYSLRHYGYNFPPKK